MDDKLFDKLSESIRQAGQIQRGEIEPGRVFDVPRVEVHSRQEKQGE